MDWISKIAADIESYKIAVGRMNRILAAPELPSKDEMDEALDICARYRTMEMLDILRGIIVRRMLAFTYYGEGAK